MSDLNECPNTDDIVHFLVTQIDSNSSLQYPEVEDDEDCISQDIQLDLDETQIDQYQIVIPNKITKRKSGRPKSKYDFYETGIPTYTPDEFRFYFRMSRSCLALLMEKLASKVHITNMEKKLLFTIWMLSTRETFSAVGSRFNLAKGASYQHFCEIIDCLLTLFKTYVKWPSEIDFAEIEQGFKPKTGGYIPGIIGAIDSCHIEIKKPSRYSIYCNPRKTHSVILQAVCDHQKIFKDVYVGAPGCLNAERVFLNSPLSKEITKLVPEDFHIVGNGHYPQMKNLVVPYIDQGVLTETQLLFNDCLRKATTTVQEAFQLLISRFRRLTYLDTSKPDLANRMICCCVILHNLVLMHDPEDVFEMYLEENHTLFLNIDPDGNTASDDDSEGLVKRNYLLSLFEYI